MVALTLRGCFLSRGYQTQSHDLAAFPASVQLPKLAVDPVPAQVPEQIIVLVSPQLPGLAFQFFGFNTVMSRSMHKCLNWRLIGSRFDICPSLDNCSSSTGNCFGLGAVCCGGCSGVCSCYNTGANLSRTLFNWSLTGPNGTFLSNSSVDEPISFKMGLHTLLLICSNATV